MRIEEKKKHDQNINALKKLKEEVEKKKKKLNILFTFGLDKDQSISKLKVSQSLIEHKYELTQAKTRCKSLKDIITDEASVKRKMRCLVKIKSLTLLPNYFKLRKKRD